MTTLTWTTSRVARNNKERQSKHLYSVPVGHVRHLESLSCHFCLYRVCVRRSSVLGVVGEEWPTPCVSPPPSALLIHTSVFATWMRPAAPELSPCEIVNMHLPGAVGVGVADSNYHKSLGETVALMQLRKHALHLHTLLSLSLQSICHSL